MDLADESYRYPTKASRSNFINQTAQARLFDLASSSSSTLLGSEWCVAIPVALPPAIDYDAFGVSRTDKTTYWSLLRAISRAMSPKATNSIAGGNATGMAREHHSDPERVALNVTPDYRQRYVGSYSTPYLSRIDHKLLLKTRFLMVQLLTSKIGS